MSKDDKDRLSRELMQLRELVWELGRLTERVHEAADKAIQALNEGGHEPVR